MNPTAPPLKSRAGGADRSTDPPPPLPAFMYDQLRAVARAMMRRQPPGHTLQATAVVHEAWIRLANCGIDLAALAHSDPRAADATRRPADLTGDENAASPSASTALGLATVAVAGADSAVCGLSIDDAAAINADDDPAVSTGLDDLGPTSRTWLLLASRIIRHVIIDHCRRAQRQKRGGGQRPVSLDEQRVGGVQNGTSAVRADALVGGAAGAGAGSGGGVGRWSPEEMLVLDEALEDLGRIGPRQVQVVEMKFFGQMTTRQIALVLGVCNRTVEEDWAVARAWLRRRLEDR